MVPLYCAKKQCPLISCSSCRYDIRLFRLYAKHAHEPDWPAKRQAYRFYYEQNKEKIISNIREWQAIKKQDPEWRAAYNEKAKLIAQKKRDRLVANPRAFTEWKEARSTNYRNTYQKIKADPIKYADYKDKHRERMRRYYQNMKANNPAKYEAYKQKQKTATLNRAYIRRQASKSCHP